MGAWLAANYGTIIVSIVLAALVAVIIVFQVRRKKQGKPSCGGDCAHCGGVCRYAAAQSTKGGKA